MAIHFKITDKIMSKSVEAVWVIVLHSMAGAALEFPPTPGFETTKEIPLAANEIAMCIHIAKIYSGIEYSRDFVKTLLKEAGIASGAAVSGAYIASKAGKSAAKELVNLGGPIAWAAKGIVGGTLTASIGITFMKFCQFRFS